jgi:glycosyltransferase involved in cell wall biosynthesis
MSLPLVSILIPTYNGERFLRETLRSALDQTHRNIEVVVADDASTDSTPEILAEFAAADPRVRVIRHERNLGAYENPGAVLRHARGEFIKYLLHDDLLAPNCVHVLLKGMRSPDVSLAFSHRQLVSEDGAPVAGHEFPKVATSARTVSGRELGDFCLENLTNVIGEVTTCMFRRGDVDLHWLWQVDDRRMAALGDLSLWLRLLSRGGAFYDPRTLSSFRVHSGQQSRLTRIRAGASRDWPILIDWARRHGFLRGPGQELRAHSRALLNAASVHSKLHAETDGSTPLEAVFLSAARLLELRGAAPASDVSSPLPERGHAPAVLEAFSQQLDVWSPTSTLALAVPALDAVEVDATVDAFRAMEDSGAADRFVLAVSDDRLAEMAPLAESALARGRDIDVELAPTDDPAALLTERWIAVAPHGATWHGGRAAVWTFPLPMPQDAVVGSPA